jgi:hypothetical protein
MIRLPLAFILGLVTLRSAAFLYLCLGYAPVATKAAPLPFERRITAWAKNARVSRRPQAISHTSRQGKSHLWHQVVCIATSATD